MIAELAWGLGLFLGVIGGYLACRLNSITFAELDRIRDAMDKNLADAERRLRTPQEISRNHAATQVRCRCCGADRFLPNGKNQP